MVRSSYRANFTIGTGGSPSPTADPFFGLVFDATESDFDGPINYDRDDLHGGYPAPRRYVGWQTFFDLGDGQIKNHKKIDTKISSVLAACRAAELAIMRRNFAGPGEPYPAAPRLRIQAQTGRNTTPPQPPPDHSSRCVISD